MLKPLGGGARRGAVQFTQGQVERGCSIHRTQQEHFSPSGLSPPNTDSSAHLRRTSVLIEDNHQDFDKGVSNIWAASDLIEGVFL